MKRLLVFLLLAATGLSAGTVRADEGEWERPFHGLLPDPNPDSRLEADDGRLWHTTRILDAETGQPVPGATLYWYPERILDWWIEHAFLLGHGVADERGYAFVRADDERWDGDAHWIADAPGFAPTHDYGSTPAELMWLERGRTVTARALDAHGRPVKNTRVDYFKGCGHAPVLRTATTGDGGYFTLEDVDPNEGNVWIEAHGSEVDYRSIRELFEYGDRVHDLVLQQGWTARGRIVDGRGRPIAGAVVRSLQTHRGPARMTDADGRFVLPAVSAREGFYIHHPASLLGDDHPAPNTWDHDDIWLHDVPMEIRLSPLGCIGPPRADATLRVRVFGDGGRALPGVSFLALSGSGFAVESATSEGPADDDEELGQRTLPVAAGTWRILPDDPFGPWTFDPVTVTTKADETREVEITARAQPLLFIENQPDDWQWMLLVGGRADLQNNEAGTPWTPHVPAEGPVTLWLQSRDDCPLTLFQAGPVVEGLRTATVAMPVPHRIGVRDSSDASGLPGADFRLVLRGTDIDVHFEESGRRDYHTTYASGALDLVVQFDDDTVTRVPLDLPEEGGATVDIDVAEHPRVDDVRDVESASIELRLPDGSQPIAVTVSEKREGGASWGEFDEVWRCRPDAWVDLTAPGYRDVRVRPGKPGRHVITYGTCTLEVDVTDTQGGPLYDEALVWIDDSVYLTNGGMLRLRGYDPGAHDVIVVARDPEADSIEHGKRLRVVLEPGETRKLTIVLPSRD